MATGKAEKCCRPRRSWSCCRRLSHAAKCSTYRRARALVDLSRECAAASRTRCAAMFCKIGQLFSGSGASLNVAKGYFPRMRSSKRRGDYCRSYREVRH